MKVSPEQFGFLRTLLRRKTGVVIDDSKQYLVIARLMPIVKKRAIPSLDTLIDRMKGGLDPSLERDVLNAMMTHETSFFRDKSPFETLRSLIEELMPKRKVLRQLTIVPQSWTLSIQCPESHSKPPKAPAVQRSQSIAPNDSHNRLPPT